MKNIILIIMPNVEDIRYLLKGGQSRETNDEENKIREDILTNILYIDNDEYLNNPEFGIHWKKIKEKFNKVLNTLCENEPFKKIEIEHKGGMGYNYDFIVQFLGQLNETTNTRTLIKEVKLEFKHNNSTILKLPQFLELYDKDCKTKYNICDTSYSEFFYENYLDEYLKLEENILEPKPNKDDYLKNIHDIKYNHPFFKNMYETKTNKTKEKRTLATISINDYLKKYVETFNFEKILEKIRESQSGKSFLLWDCENFHIQEIDVNSVQILKIKDISVIEKKMYFDLSLTNFDYDLRIRINWGNNACVANPRWKFTFINK
jgi:hypothetical protein